jgi:hypothetical protein
VLLGWPASRGAVWLAETIVWTAAGALVLACGFAGFLVSVATLPPAQRPEVGLTLLTLLAFYASYLLVGAAAQCIGAWCDRRGRALGLAVAFVLVSYLVNFLSQFWAPARHVVAASFVHYYRPADVFLRGELAWHDLVVLAVAGVVLWSAGRLVWCRRSVLTI